MPISENCPHTTRYGKDCCSHFVLQTRVLVTNAITFLPKTDKIIVLKNGTVSEMGKYEELLERRGAFSEFIQQYLVEMDDDDEDSESKTSF